MGENAQTRLIGLDIIRCCAIFFVIAGHFFNIHTAYKNTIFEGISLFMQSIANSLFQIGVPLFLLLTGYLNINKKVNKKYYRGITKVLISYILFSLITIIFRKYYLSENLSWIQWALKILDFSAIPYAWYIEMWIGLFLLTPFLNILYKGVATQKQKQILIGILFIMTALPDFLNRYEMHLVPGFWKECYPLTFYFIGAYIQEYKPIISKKLAGIIILGICSINPIFNLLFIHKHTLIQICAGPTGVFGVVVSVLFFLMIYPVQIQNKIRQRLVTLISVLSLEMYLCCYLFDALYYPYFKQHYFINQSQFGIYFFIIVPLVFLSSLIVSFWKNKIAYLMKK